MFQEFVTGLHHLVDIHTERRRNGVHVQTLVALWARLERLIDATRSRAHVRHRPSPCSRCRLAIPISTTGVLPEGSATFGCASLGDLLKGAAGEVEMHVSRLEQVVCDFHLIGDGTDDVRTYVAPVVERFQLSPDPSPIVFYQFWSGGNSISGIVNRRALIGVNPLFYFNGASAIVELVGYVCSLGRYIADLANEGHLLGRQTRSLVSRNMKGKGAMQGWGLHLSYFDIVYGKIGVWVRLRGIQDLQYADGSKRIFSICALG